MFFPSKALSQWGRWKKQAGDERGQVEEKGKRGKGKRRKREKEEKGGEARLSGREEERKTRKGKQKET